MNDNDIAVRIIGDASQVAPAVDLTKAELKGLNDSVAGLSSMMKDVGNQISGAMSKTTESVKSTQGAVKNLTEVGEHGFTGWIGKIHETAESLRTTQMRAKEFAEVFVAIFAIHQVVEFIRTLAEAAETTQHLAQTFGMTVNEVQQLGAVAKLTGIPLQEITRSMQVLDRNALTAASGTGVMASAFKAVGISVNDGRTQMERLYIVADKFKDMDDGPKKVALAMQLLGRSGAQMIPVLNLGSEGLKKMETAAEEYDVANTKVSASAQTKGMALAESVNESKLAWAGLLTIVTDAAAPAFKEMADGMSGLIAEMVKSYNEGGTVAVVFQAIAAIIEIVGAAINGLAGIFKALWDVVGGVLAAIGGAIADVFGIKVKDNVNYAEIMLNQLKATFVLVKDVIVIAIELIGAAIQMLVVELVRFGKVAWDAFTLNWGAIEGDWAAGTQKIAEYAEAAAKKVAVSMAEARQAILAFANGTAMPGADKGIPSGKGAGGDFNPSLGGSKSHTQDTLMQELEAELAAKKTAWAMQQDAQGTAQEFSLQSEEEFWAKQKDRANLTVKDRLGIEEKWLAARQALQREANDRIVSGYREELTLARDNWAEKLGILNAEHDYMVHMYGAESKEARAAQQAIVQGEREAAKQRLQIELELEKSQEQINLQRVADALAHAQFLNQLGVMSNRQLLTQEANFETQSYAIRRASLTRQLALVDPARDPVKYAQINAQIEAAEQAHQNKLSEIERKSVLERTAIERRGIQDLSRSWTQTLAQMATLQMSWAQGVKSLWMGLVNVIAQALATMVEQWLIRHLTAMLITRAQTAVTGLAQVTSNAAVAASGAYAATAVIPFVGPELAPAAAAAAFIGAMAYAPLASAAGGDWQVRAGLYKLHAEEMVLPAWAAIPLRNMISGSSSGQMRGPANDSHGGGGGDNVHLHLHGDLIHDPHQLRKWFEKHRSAVGAGIKSYARQGGR